MMHYQSSTHDASHVLFYFSSRFPLTLTFAQISSLLRASFRIREGMRSAFENRIKNLQRLGIFPEINTGRGRAAKYHVGHAYLLVVAFSLVEQGFTPERVVFLMQEYRKVFQSYLKLMLREKDAVNVFATISPEGLAQFQRRPLTLHGEVNFWTEEQLRNFAADSLAVLHKRFIVDLGQVVFTVSNHLRMLQPISWEEARTMLRDWSEEVPGEFMAIFDLVEGNDNVEEASRSINDVD